MSRLLKQAIFMAQSGEKDRARPIFKQLLDEDPLNETAWIWYVDSIFNPEEKMQAIEKWLKANPDSRAAQVTIENFQKQYRLTGKYPGRLELPPTPPLGTTTPTPRQAPLEEVEDFEEEEPQPKKKRKRGSCFYVIANLFGLGIVLAFCGVVGIIGAQYMGYDTGVSGLFATPTSSYCFCVEADAYMQRAKNRVERWRTNQALYMLGGMTGNLPGDISMARQLYIEEYAEVVPVCVSQAHNLFLKLLDSHIKYSEALQQNNKFLTEFYRDAQSEYQEKLSQEFLWYSREGGLSCIP